MALSGSTLCIGGDFTQVIHHAPASAGRPRGTLLSGWVANTDYGVNALAAYGNYFYAGGNFTTVTNSTPGAPAPSVVTHKYVVKLAASNGAVQSWSPEPDNTVHCLAIDPPNLYMGGIFHYLGSTTRNFLASVDLTSGVPTTWNPQPDYYIFGLAQVDHLLMVGGSNTFMGTDYRPYLSFFAIKAPVGRGWEMME